MEALLIAVIGGGLLAVPLFFILFQCPHIFANRRDRK